MKYLQLQPLAMVEAYGNGSLARAGGYTYNTRGAGAMQLTHASAHQTFLQLFMGYEASVAQGIGNTAQYIADNYPWESAAFFWTWNGGSIERPTDGRPFLGRTTINDWITTQVASTRETTNSQEELEERLEGIFLVLQYSINGFTIPFSTADRILAGDSWSITNPSGSSTGYRLQINGDDLRAPNGWAHRMQSFDYLREFIGR